MLPLSDAVLKLLVLSRVEVLALEPLERELGGAWFFWP